ncbi:histidinol-phosphate transaminase [Pontibacter sp. G13]|uniref:pyridoxal phosphate-dependent aminotransferase n=1 Tax=Pontibacter sp. G13 TaxID=3074898 RepID=UPI00288988C5|nr:histidinol-phosphate transaminase [Pontibacter sp. G13]WNJ19640.1 histidinol-phosphate transaminase [Pontibacter sp. G13]
MSKRINRRDWLRSSALLAAGAAIAPSALQADPIRSASTTSQFQFLDDRAIFPHHQPALRARLLANENPYGPSAAAKEALMNAISQGNRYPMRSGRYLGSMIAEMEGVSQEQIMMSPGSTALLDRTAIVLCSEGGQVLTADPSYMSLVETAKNLGATWKKVKLTKDWEHDLDAMKAAITDEVKLVYICNPNNPTATITNPEKLKAFCAEVSEQVPVFVDEAYLEFLDEPEKHSMVSLVQAGKNVIISRTFSKIHGMAGLRAGYVLAQPEMIEKMQTLGWVQWGISATTIEAATASLKDTAFLDECRQKNKEAREFTYETLQALELDYLPSSANFILFPLRMRTEAFQQAMFAKQVGIRVFEIGKRPYCRVSLGTMEEMTLFTDALKEIVG